MDGSVRRLMAVQPGAPQRAQADLVEVRDAPDRASAEARSRVSADKDGAQYAKAAKYAKAVECLVKDQDALLRVFDFPA